jgi:hypothetical protein
MATIGLLAARLAKGSNERSVYRISWEHCSAPRREQLPHPEKRENLGNYGVRSVGDDQPETPFHIFRNPSDSFCFDYSFPSTFRMSFPGDIPSALQTLASVFTVIFRLSRST